MVLRYHQKLPGRQIIVLVVHFYQGFSLHNEGKGYNGQGE
jgi:hypothetical protein